MKLIVANTSWADTLPEWLIQEITTEQTIEALAGLIGKDLRDGRATLAEVGAYLYTAALAAPLPHETAQIYFYVVTTLMKRQGKTVPEDIAVLELPQYEQQRLEELQGLIFRSRGRARTPLTDALQEVFKEAKREEKAARKKKAPGTPDIAPANTFIPPAEVTGDAPEQITLKQITLETFT